MALSIDAPLSRRLTVTNGAILGALFAFVLIGVLAWFYHFEREELIENRTVNLKMLAVQTKAALMFGDEIAIRDDLDALRSAEEISWAAISDGKSLRVTYGSAPANLESLRANLMGTGNRIDEWSRLVLREEIRQDEVIVGDVIAEINLSTAWWEFLQVATTAAAVALLLFLVGLTAIYRYAKTISQPLQDLARQAQAIERQEAIGLRTKNNGADEIGTLAASFDSMLEALKTRETELQKSNDQLRHMYHRLTRVREDERTRLARDVHDDIGQRLTALRIDTALLFAVGETAHPSWDSLASQFDQAIDAVRRISWDLRPSILDMLGLAAAIEWLGEDFQRRMATRCRVLVPTDLPAMTSVASTSIFRICQELLTNIMRHANASRVDIVLEFDAQIRLCVQDNGVGLPPDALAGGSLGLTGIIERLTEIGGALAIATRPEFAGTRIEILVPFSMELA
jgi:signal transduction histidine kinase